MRDCKLSAITLLSIVAAACACTFQSPPTSHVDAALFADAGVLDSDICEFTDAPFLLAGQAR
jgi:hypothetical protein